MTPFALFARWVSSSASVRPRPVEIQCDGNPSREIPNQSERWQIGSFVLYSALGWLNAHPVISKPLGRTPPLGLELASDMHSSHASHAFGRYRPLPMYLDRPSPLETSAVKPDKYYVQVMTRLVTGKLYSVIGSRVAIRTCCVVFAAAARYPACLEMVSGPAVSPSREIHQH